ncbi:sugar-binding protein [Christensenellaceae bacterium OttesenSCG-928-L17]|nr:sugar-binding protein [Christensenellaceae bacterium OttesenSCG-928-L17]
MKRIAALLLLVALVFSAAACGNEDEVIGGVPIMDPEEMMPEEMPDIPYTLEAKLVGIALPARDIERWSRDGAELLAQFQSKDYIVKLCFDGEGEIATQESQIRDMINNGCKLLLIAATDEAALENVLDYAQAEGVLVVAYDRPINHAGTDYYLSFSGHEIGRIQADYIHNALNLENAAGPFAIEIFAGDISDRNTAALYAAAMEVLAPHIESGKLIVPSGKTELIDVTTSGWSEEAAYKRMQKLLQSEAYLQYGSTYAAVLCANDSIARGVIRALKEVFGEENGFPVVVTGQDCEIAAVQAMIAGYQGMSVFKDTRLLAAQAVKTADALFLGELPEMNNAYIVEGSENAVPAFYCTPVLVTKENHESVLLHSSYYTEQDLAAGE